jgi:hypothetical protein
MNKESFWKILAIILLVVNIGILGFLVLDRRGGNMPAKPDKLIIEGLHLDEVQIEQFQQLKKAHRNGIDSLDEAEIQVRKSIFAEIQNGMGSDSIQNQNLQKLAEIRNQKDQTTLLHFRELYKLCREDQKAYYHTTIEEVAKILMRGNLGARVPKIGKS